jgi:hypothetical protein
MAKANPGQRLDLDILQRCLLGLCEISDLRLRKLDVFNRLARNGSN